ncbi:unnamed protein product [marine sediment metagenome]|uniref:Uncharacterized protein n=1 Tax=marine sediment metagenome TaxID=412755 RepID=X1IJS4_9ZZZZ
MDIQPLDILKWVGLVFAAGFIGYFGRHLSMVLIERMRRRKSTQAAETESKGDVAAAPENIIELQRIKAEKKRAKAETKRLKKERG